MSVTYNLHTDELTDNVMESIKAAFQDSKSIDITVSESMDETEYLMATKANREHLESSLRDLEEGKGITFTIEEFQKKYGNERNNF